MFGTEFNVDRIVRIFANNKLRIPLHKAFRVAGIIMDICSERMIEVETNAYNKGKEIGYENGYKAGKMDSDEYSRGYYIGLAEGKENNSGEIDRLLTIERNMISLAVVAADKIAESYPQEKIKCIKLLRQKSGLSLAESKRIMDAAFDSMRARQN